MKINTKKILLPILKLTEITTGNDPEAVEVAVPSIVDGICDTYFTRPKLAGINGKQRNGRAQWNKRQYNCFPLVMDSHRVPWAEAVVYILSRLESVAYPVMATYSSIADDLAAYRRFLDDTGIDWTHFPTQKMARPTYRFNGHLKFAVAAGEISATLARRQMRTIIGFYRNLQAERVLVPENPLWKESDCYIDFKDSRGFDRTKKIITTDVSIKISKQNNPYDGCIDDGGKLRPLPVEEQEWLIDALVSLGNTEMTLIHLFGILTGARIQTILTFQVKHVAEMKNEQLSEIRIPIGPGTGVDTKYDKQMVLHLPMWFYQMLHTYAKSNRSRRRREKAAGGDHDGQYLFLSVRGVPLYQSKQDRSNFDESNELRHVKTGQGVRQFISERIIPFIRQKHKKIDFHYQFHDTRATAGMNWTDHQLKLVEQGKSTLHKAREFVKTRMGHASAATTDRYLQYRGNLKLVRWANQEYEDHLKQLAEQAMNGLL